MKHGLESDIPFFLPKITKEDKKAVQDALNSSLFLKRHCFLTANPCLRTFFFTRREFNFNFNFDIQNSYASTDSDSIFSDDLAS